MNRRLAILLAMAMFVLVVDTSLMNVSIAAVVRGSGHHGQRCAVGDRVGGAGVGSIHPDRQQGRRPHRTQEGLRAGSPRLRGRRHGDDPGPGFDRDHHLLGGRRRARRVPAVAGHAVTDPRQLPRRGAEEGLRPGRRRRRDRRRGRAAAGRVHHHLPVLAGRVPAGSGRHRRGVVRHQTRPRRALHRAAGGRHRRGDPVRAGHGRHRARHPGLAGGRRGGRRPARGRRGRDGRRSATGWCAANANARPR